MYDEDTRPPLDRPGMVAVILLVLAIGGALALLALATT